jgi:nucleotide-binding universal stress UspA family protein
MGGSLYAESALDEVIKVFGGSYATFHLLRIIEPITGPQLYYDDDELPIDLAKAYIDSRFSDAEEYLAEQAEALRRDGLSATSEVNVGPVADAILDSWEADLIALASHGQTGARWFGMGSVAGRVLAEATVPVLMVGARSM